MILICITNDRGLAHIADAAGVDRIMVDLEWIGKKERQIGRDSVISGHCLDDVRRIREVVGEGKLQVRVNPIHRRTEEEVEAVLERGADVVMLPMFVRASDVQDFISLVSGRAKVSLLLETPAAMVRADEILRIEGIDEVHIGLNDLHIALGLDFMFEVLSGGIVEYLAQKIKAHGHRFGFGGIARLGEGVVDARLVLSEHVRLGSTMAMLCRTFFRGIEKGAGRLDVDSVREAVTEVRGFVSYLAKVGPEQLRRNAALLKAQIRQRVR